ncbi:uncharacterized protein LOC114295730 [Camellia sinensis]|uniref:uncharacterized protein LOC114295730 n=1 Tax=Camellia sinensis TaxID=4442 RepID=UPI0010355FA9|nr:uncharacterized protein LOC114295730 [Camellia sinensis]
MVTIENREEVVKPESVEPENDAGNAYSPSDYISPVGQNRPNVEFPVGGELCVIRGNSPRQETDDLAAMEEDFAKFQFCDNRDLEYSAVNWYDNEESAEATGWLDDQPDSEPERFKDSERIRKAKGHVGVETATSMEMENAASKGIKGTASIRTVMPEPDRCLSAADAMRILSYGMAADAVDDYIRIGESIAIQSLQQFCNSVIEIFEPEYLRSPTPTDIARLLAIGEVWGFSGMLGSLDCMHWEWKNCPKAWQGQYVGHKKKSTIILEAVASYDLWIWYAFFGMPGSHNDLNVLDRSPLFSDLAYGKAPLVLYTINGHSYNMSYYLADGIYLNG